MGKSFVELVESTKYYSLEESHVDKNKLVDLLWKYGGGLGFDSKESIYKDYKSDIDKIVSGKVSYQEALDMLGIAKENEKDAKDIVSYLKKNLK